MSETIEGPAEATESHGANERLVKDLELMTFARDAGSEVDNPTSILDIVAGSKYDTNYPDLLNAAHDRRILSDTFSSHDVDSLRYIIETAPDKTTPFLDAAQQQGPDIAAEAVVKHWEDLELLLGIGPETSRATLTEDERKPMDERSVKHPDRIKSGAVMFESQNGAWGAGSTW